LKIFDGAYCHALYALLLHNDQRNAAGRLWRASQDTDARNGATNSRGPNGLIQCAYTSDLDYEIDAVP
jgi:hypothetical protein